MSPSTKDRLLRGLLLCSGLIIPHIKQTLQNIKPETLEFLCKQDTIDYIITGMRKPPYVQEIMALKDELNNNFMIC